METIYTGEFEYQPHLFPKGRNVSRCHLEVLKQGDTALVVATELASNPGMSITNSSEHLASKVVQQFKLDPTKTTFIEHYNDESYGGTPPGRRRDPDHYSTVEYTWENGEAKRPRWVSLNQTKFDQLPQALTLLAELNGLKVKTTEDIAKKVEIRYILGHDYGYSTNRQDDGTYKLVPIVEEGE